jgi:hypothetical protein
MRFMTFLSPAGKGLPEPGIAAGMIFKEKRRGGEFLPEIRLYVNKAFTGSPPCV